jgi:hypothetical protein
LLCAVTVELGLSSAFFDLPLLLRLLLASESFMSTQGESAAASAGGRERRRQGQEASARQR